MRPTCGQLVTDLPRGAGGANVPASGCVVFGGLSASRIALLCKCADPGKHGACGIAQPFTVHFSLHGGYGCRVVIPAAARVYAHTLGTRA